MSADEVAGREIMFGVGVLMCTCKSGTSFAFLHASSYSTMDKPGDQCKVVFAGLLPEIHIAGF